MDLKLTGKNVLVTGGAAGIGAGICKVFAAEGANVVVNYRSHQAEAEAFAQGLRETYGVDALAIQADITAPEATEKLFTQALAHFGILDVLVNNAAGGICFKPFQEYTEEDWHLAQAGICDHVFRMSQLFLRACLETGREGRIINILSKSAILSSSIHNLTYVTNKGGSTGPDPGDGEGIRFSGGVRQRYCAGLCPHPGACPRDGADGASKRLAAPA